LDYVTLTCFLAYGQWESRRFTRRISTSTKMSFCVYARFRSWLQTDYCKATKTEWGFASVSSSHQIHLSLLVEQFIF
jgi:hypothetical protein